jgi:thiamine-phosphate pyrophosphorylase
MAFPLKIPRLLAISDPGVRPGAAWQRWCRDLETAGVDGLEVRSKVSTDRELLALASEARAQTSVACALLVNERFDIALATDAAGVHLPASAPGAASIRTAAGRLAARALLVGRSTHTVDEVRRAHDEGADYVLFGPVFETPSKAGRIAPRGLVGLAAAVACGMPVLALGGIDASTASRALDAGAWGLAAIRWFEDPLTHQQEYAALRTRWEEA